MKKILMLTTGGTIASVPGEEGLVPAFTGKDLIALLPQLKEMGHIETKAITNLDSSNMQPEEWIHMAREIYQGLQKYDGFVITHGTDTMAYSSAALSYMLPNLGAPVVFTGSQLPLDAPDTDAKKNMLHAFIIATNKFPGVFVVFDGKVIRGTRAVKTSSTGISAFESINAPYVGSLEGNRIIKGAAPPYPREAYQPSTSTGLKDNLDTNVFLLKLFPGMRPDLLSKLPSLGYSGLVVESFGAGGLPFHRRDLLHEIKILLDRNISVAVTTQCWRDGTAFSIYEVGQKTSQAGVIPGGNMTTEALVTKLMWTLGQTRNLEEVKKIMQTNLCGEL